MAGKPICEKFEERAEAIGKEAVECKRAEKAPTIKEEPDLSNMEMENPYLVDGKYCIKDLVDIENLRKTLENFSRATGFTTGFIEYPSQEILIATGWRDICTKFHRAVPGSAKHCRESNIFLTNRLKKQKELNIKPCGNGLVDGATPIVIKGKYIAYLATGQVLFEKPDIERFKNHAEMYGYDLDAYLEALDKVPVVSQDQFKNTLSFLSELAVTIAETGFKNLELKEKTKELGEEIACRKLAEKTLQETLDSYEKIFFESPIGISIYGASGQCISANDSFGELVGASRESVLKQNYNNLESWKKSGLFHKAELALREHSKKRHEMHVRSTSGKYVSLDCHLIPFSSGGQPQLLLMTSDIRERLQAEEALRQSEKRLEKINECFLRFGTDANKNINYLTALCGELLGATCSLYNRLDGDMLCSWGQWNIPIDYNPVDTPDGHICYDVIKSAGDETLVITNLPDTPYAGTDPNVIPYKLKTYLGRSVKLRDDYVGSLCVVYQDDIVPDEADKRVMEIIASAIGVEEERKRVEAVLRDSEEKYRTVLEGNPDPVVVYDMEGKVLYFNPAFTHVFGWTLEEFLGKKLDVFVPEDAWPKTKVMIEKVLEGERFSNVETRRYTKNGEIVPVSISGATYRDRDGNPLGNVINLRDISEQKQLESQLRQAQRMESMGILSGGIAHDFNNVLMGIQGRTSIMLMNKDSSHTDFEHLKGIEDYVENAAGLTKQLLGFARGGKYEVKPTDLNELINKQNRMFGRTKRELTIHKKYEKDLWSVEVDLGQIEQVLLNLYVNASQAMPAGGDLHIRTQNVTLDENDSEPHQVEPGKYVKISITDTGVGMDKATLERIFEPFFTTKVMGRGTGLGLASTYGIIKNHGGFINVYSEKGHGSTFHLYLPASPKEVIGEKNPRADTLRGSETVLFVDDEDMIIEIAEELLDALGYKVLIARSGKKAIEMYEDNRQRIDMVILDMIMPDMSGGETYDRMKEMNPKLKALLSSGYSVNGQATEILNRGCNGFIQKPFKMKELSQKLREILDGK